jgi:PmbA protein
MSIKDLILPYKQALQADTTVARWRIHATSSEHSAVGFSKKDVADIYQPATQQNSSYLQYAIEFGDLNIAYGNLNPTQTNPEQMLELAKVTAVTSSEELGLPPYAKQADLPTLTPPEGYEKNLLTKLLPEATTLREKLLKVEPKAFEGELTGTRIESIYCDSNDLELSESEVSYKGGYEYNGKLDYSYATRTYDKLMPKVTASLPLIAEYAKGLEEEIITTEETRLPVFVVDGTTLIDNFLLDHMVGMSIVSHSSRFKKEDFDNHLAVAHPGLTLQFDQTIDLLETSFGFSQQGVTSQKFTLLDKGKLVEPMCDLRASQRLGYAPRVDVTTDEAIFTDLPTFDELSKSTGTFLLAFSLLGIHTQNTMLGSYSLPCPECLFFKDGKLVGPVKPVITGNFFDVLKDPTTQFVSTTLSQAPMLFFETDVSF